MAPKTIRHSDEEWLGRKSEIRELFLRNGLSLLAVMQHLESQGFSVTKSQLEYKLKAWGFKKKLPKNSSKAGWQYVRHHVEKRKDQGKKSEVILNGRRLDQQTVERETARHHSSAWSSSFQIAMSPRTPEGFPVSICTPPALQMDFKWHHSLPWIQFQTEVNFTFTTPLDRLGNVKILALPPVPIRLKDFCSIKSKTSVSDLASTIGSIMPESYQGENFSRAEKLARGPSNDATQEHINIAIFKLSNKLRTNLTWDETLDFLETSGIMSTGVQLNQHPDSLRTISALAEVLYEDALGYLYDSRSYEAPWQMQPRSVKLVTWLLSLGYRSDTYIPLSLWPHDRNIDSKATGLQIAICCENYELACTLLDARANPNLLGHHTHPFHDDHMVLLPPLSIAICCRNSPGRNAIIRRLLAAGADVRAEQERERRFLVKVSTLSTLAACGFAEQEEAEMQETMDILCIAQADFVTADVLIAAAWNGKMKNLELLLQINPDVNMTNPLGLTALHAAAYQGHADICKMLIQKGCSIDHPDGVAPSPLHLAAYRDHTDIVIMLHQHGAGLIRGITITEHNYAVVSSRYFLDVFHDDSEERSYSIKSWVEMKELASLLESPAGAAVHASDVESEDTIAYMVQHGAKLPTPTVWFASSRQSPQLLSLALRQNLNPDHRGPDDRTPLQTALFDVLEYEKNSGCVQIVSKLLDAGAMVVGGEAILALCNLGSWDVVERILSSDYDDVAERYDLIPHWRYLPFRIGNTLLETAILRGSEILIGHVLARNPSEYSAGALCAATLQAAQEGNRLALLKRLLQNRAKLSSTHQDDVICETTAVGIAAWSGNSAILRTLHAYIPVSDLAYLPNGDTSVNLASTVADPSHIPRSGSLSFWHEARFNSFLHLMGSPVNFALDKPNILDQLLRYGYKLDRISLAIIADSGDTSTMRSLIQRRDILHNEYASRIHRPLYHAITNRDLEMSTLLLEFGEDINDNESGIVNSVGVGRSPLARAIEEDSLPLIEMLLKAGADVNAPPSWYNGRTALQCAAAQGSLGIAKQLIDRGADINTGRCERYGRTALEAAAECGRIDMVQFLLSEGVETTGNGRHQYVGAIARAQIQGHDITAKILREHRLWTDQDQLLWQSEDLLESDAGDWEPGAEGWEKDHEEFGMISAGEEAEGSGGRLVGQDIENIEEEDGIEGDAMDWDAFNGATFINEGVIAEPGFIVGDELADIWFKTR